MDNKEAIEMMNRCIHDLEDQRRWIKNLQPKAEAYEVITKIMDLIPGRSQGVAPDIVWELKKRIRELESQPVAKDPA